MPAMDPETPNGQQLCKQQYTWSSFKLDALGLITLLGSQEVDQALGSMTYHMWCEYLPLLASNIVAADSLTKPLPGYQLFNLTDKMQALDLSGWFSRWIQQRDLNYASSCMIVTLLHNGKNVQWPMCLHILVGFLFIAVPLLTSWFTPTICRGDRAIGVINAISLLGTILCRSFNMIQMRRGVDRVVEDMYANADPMYPMTKECKVRLTLPNGKSVGLLAQRGIVRSLLKTPKPISPRLYLMSRVLCWISFGIHAITLGSTTVLYQIACVTTILVSTILLLHTSCFSRNKGNEIMVGTKLKFTVATMDCEEKHTEVYARMAMTREEEGSMRMWGLMPHASNQEWWAEYNRVKRRFEPCNCTNPSSTTHHDQAATSICEPASLTPSATSAQTTGVGNIEGAEPRVNMEAGTELENMNAQGVSTVGEDIDRSMHPQSGGDGFGQSFVEEV